MSGSIHLITGLPRSGTTLCCQLLNQRIDTIALHEPIDPSLIPNNANCLKAVDYIVQSIDKLDYAIERGLPFEHGHKGGLELDNPIGVNSENGVRKQVAKRGLVQLSPKPASEFTLIIKQNALFTALLPHLSARYPMVCIVRNPVDVLLSWLTVDLPVNRGHIPAGERFNDMLKNKLVGLNCSRRQLTIYQWFIDQFLESGLPIVRYEDVISTSGKVLDNALGFDVINRSPLIAKNRVFSESTLNQLQSMSQDIIELNCGALYSKNDILAALSKHNIIC